MATPPAALPPNLNVRQHMVTCDESNNPPSVRAEGQLRARFYIQFEDQYTGEHYVFTLPIDLKSLREGTLTSVPVEHLR